ncbi:MAG TPA: hypothetical protein GX707_11845 [Epulopiscium sp.]|nr:hypothetical protein [Candidatus Epulonipiscium sp.]
MFNKKEYRLLLLGAMAVFFIIALFIYMFYIGFKQTDITQKPLESNQLIQASDETPNQILEQIPDQTVMAQDILRIKASTNIIIEIIDQFGFITQTDRYEGINWLDYTQPELGKIFPDYIITKYEEDEVILTRTIERQTEPNYILTIHEGNIVISTEQSGYKIFYKETGLEQHDLSDILESILEKGIPITQEQKEAILEDANQVYMILQEYDE